jgi:hypothetical protein
MIIYYLYIKTHNITGLKYLGQTSKQDPYSYCGSGKDWKPHINEYGADISTEILASCETKHELNSLGRFYSTYYRITTAVDDYGNRIWANRIPETGGGTTPSLETREKLRIQQLGKKKPLRTVDHKNNISKSCTGIKKHRTEEHQRKLNTATKLNWVDNPDRKKQIGALGKSNKGRKQSQETLDKKRLAMKEYWVKKKSQFS